ncbi:MAG: hypothetical protein V3U63_00835 [Gemmatimonadota bacterium]
MNGPAERDSAQPRVLSLRCRACSATLPAASSDVAFRCAQCGRGWEIEQGELVERPALYIAPPANPSHALLYLPYWSFRASAAAQPKRRLDEGVLAARDRAAGFKRAYIAAYAIHRPTYVGEWGLIYTRAQPEWETRAGHGPQSPGASLAARDAAVVVEHYILAEIDKAADLGSLQVSVEISDPELWAVPCLDMGEFLRCPWSGAELPASALDDLAEMRHATEERHA